ncbi:O-antigen ligase family protein [Candidatus Saccharibacteria bacterium]|nr:O-antigen ligase family protein [Candidatus Saccharibacteria bacterium]
MKKLNKKSERLKLNFWNFDFLFKLFIYIFPILLFFSYYPLIHFGSSESMNFEISLPMIWLVLFDLFVFVAMVRRRTLFKKIKKEWIWLLFPVFLTTSVLWSLNSLRGILTAGILWLIYFAGYALDSFKETLQDNKFRKNFWKIFFSATLFVCVWCFLQCILDLAGVSREWTLMCEGCTYSMFGFPHPNGFAIEPQFMGNLLLAPSIIAAYSIIKSGKPVLHLYSSKTFGLLLFILTMTLFLTFSRGAIYAFLVAMVFMTTFTIMKEGWKKIAKRLSLVWGVIILAFLFTLNLQGIMAAVSPTNDTYFSGISKALNHLSLGAIDIREKSRTENFSEETQALEIGVIEEKDEAVFDGYVEESTNTRIRLNDAALKVWSKDFTTVMFGVGLGGAGQALYDNGLSSAPKEIIQNQYISLLLETGLVGIVLLILTLILIIRVVIKKSDTQIMFSLMMAYGISLLFFAGFANALHVYLMSIIIMLLL